MCGIAVTFDCDSIDFLTDFAQLISAQHDRGSAGFSSRRCSFVVREWADPRFLRQQQAMAICALDTFLLSASFPDNLDQHLIRFACFA